VPAHSRSESKRVRNGLPAGGKEIRTVGPPYERQRFSRLFDGSSNSSSATKTGSFAKVCGGETKARRRPHPGKATYGSSPLQPAARNGFSGTIRRFRHHRTRRVPTRVSGMSSASRREWCRDTLLRTSTVNPSPGDRLSQHSRSRRSDSAQDCRPQPDRQQQDHDKRCSYIQRKGGRARRSVGSGRTPGGAALTAAGLAFCGKRESAPLPENRFCRSVTNRRTLKQLFFHTANPRYRGIATERRALRGKQMKRLGGGRVRFLRRSSARPNPRQALHQGLLYKWAPQRGIQINSERHIPEAKILSVRKHLQHIFIHLQNSL